MNAHMKENIAEAPRAIEEIMWIELQPENVLKIQPVQPSALTEDQLAYIICGSSATCFLI